MQSPLFTQYAWIITKEYNQLFTYKPMFYQWNIERLLSAVYTLLKCVKPLPSYNTSAADDLKNVYSNIWKIYIIVGWLPKKVEIFVATGEIARFEFQKSSAADALKCVYRCERVYSIFINPFPSLSLTIETIWSKYRKCL